MAKAKKAEEKATEQSTKHTEKANVVEQEQGAEEMTTEEAQAIVDMHKNITYTQEPAELVQARKIVEGK